MNLSRSCLGIYHPVHKLILLLSDVILLAVAFSFAAYMRLGTTPNIQSIEYIGINLVIVSSLFLGGAYTSSGLASRPKLPLNTFFIVVMSSLPSLLLLYLLGPQSFTGILGRGVLPFALLGFGGLAVLSRYIINYLLHNPKTTKILLLGEAKDQHRLHDALTTGETTAEVSYTSQLNDHYPDANHLSAIVIAPDHLPDTAEQTRLINYRLAGIPIFSLSDFFESYLFLVPVHEINNDWFIRAEGFTMLHSSIATRIKRVFDIFVTLGLVIITTPIMLFAAIAIKLTSKGPVLFTQTRVGMQGATFTLYKFRTMRLDAEARGAQWASSKDPRILPIGHFLRATRIDELPQCWNILKGNMSIVGPRPERPEFTANLADDIPYYDLRHIIKPGLTGWAQVSYPYGASTEDALRKLQYDLYYIKNYSLLLDLNILLRTIRVTLMRTGR